MVSYNLLSRPDDIEYITSVDLSNLHLDELPDWISECVNLRVLDCSHNYITSLPELPKSLLRLYCSYNEIRFLPEVLPENLTYLDCSHNILTILPILPSTLEQFVYHDNNIYPSIHKFEKFI